ncbi:MAG: hypothetical protein NTZ13_01925 [Candidatus Parcubacteria bacterium]|nr:hypothetical protein [Candidatus Parcubacteria bacterium]
MKKKHYTCVRCGAQDYETESNFCDKCRVQALAPKWEKDYSGGFALTGTLALYASLAITLFL